MGTQSAILSQMTPIDRIAYDKLCTTIGPEFVPYFEQHHKEFRKLANLGVHLTELTAYATYLGTLGVSRHDILGQFSTLLIGSRNQVGYANTLKKLLKDVSLQRKTSTFFQSVPKDSRKVLGLGKNYGNISKPSFRKGITRGGKIFRQAERAGNFLFLLEVLEATGNARKKQDWGELAGVLSGYLLSAGFPIVTTIDVVQSFLASFAPVGVSKSLKDTLRLVNPLAWNKIGMDSAVTLWQVAIEVPLNDESCIPRLDRLVDRMKEAGLAKFVDLGELIGDRAYETRD